MHECCTSNRTSTCAVRPHLHGQSTTAPATQRRQFTTPGHGVRSPCISCRGLSLGYPWDPLSISQNLTGLNANGTPRAASSVHTTGVPSQSHLIRPMSKHLQPVHFCDAREDNAYRGGAPRPTRFQDITTSLGIRWISCVCVRERTEPRQIVIWQPP